MSYQLTLSDNAYNVIKLLMETRLNHFNQNISVYVERAIEYQQIIVELDKAEYAKDPKPVQEKKKPVAKPVLANLCKAHPNYGAKRAPRSEACSTCWSVYEKYNGQDAARRARDKLRRNLKLKDTTSGKATKSIR